MAEKNDFVAAFTAFTESVSGRQDEPFFHWVADLKGGLIAVMSVRKVLKVPSPERLDGCWGYLTNCYALPDYRNRGIGTELVERLLTLAGDRSARLWSHGDHPAAAAIAAKLGLNRVRELRRMRWVAGDVPQPQLREGVRIRAFVPGQDEAAVVSVNHRAFSWHPEQGALTVEDLVATEQQDWFDPSGFFLAVDASDRLLGFHWTKVHPGPPEAIGEVYVVGVDPDAQGGGLGKALTVIGMEHLRAAGLRSVMLYVESDNAPAVAVYSKLGFTVWDADVQYGR